jgi:hypothetical protein
VTVAAERVRVHPLARLGFGLSLAALFVAWYGSLHAEKQLPATGLRTARGPTAVIAEPGPWYEKVVDRAEVKLFGDRWDRRELEATERSRLASWLVQILGFWLPLTLGLSSAYLGASALSTIEHLGGRAAGNFQAVFAIMIGGFAAIIAGCMIVSYYIWPHVPSLYTL